MGDYHYVHHVSLYLSQFIVFEQSAYPWGVYACVFIHMHMYVRVHFICEIFIPWTEGDGLAQRLYHVFSSIWSFTIENGN